MAWNDEGSSSQERQTRMHRVMAARGRAQMARVAQAVDQSSPGSAQSYRTQMLLSALMLAAALLLANLQ